METNRKSDDSTASKKRKEPDQLWRQMFEKALYGILILDFETETIVNVNPFLVKYLGVPKKELLGKRLWEIGLFNNLGQSEQASLQLKKRGSLRIAEIPLHLRDGKISEVELISNVYSVGQKKTIQCTLRDITKQKQNQQKQELTAKFITLLNSESNWKKLIKTILQEVKNHTGIDVVGLRLKKGDDYPYYESVGFPEDLIHGENYPCVRNKTGQKVSKDHENPHKACLYSEVIAGRVKCLPGFYNSTNESGSISTETAQLLSSPADEKIFSSTCSRCNVEGYGSVALVPLYAGKELIGLFQMYDQRPGLFTSKTIHFTQDVGNIIGIILRKIQYENEIKDYQQIVKKQKTDFIHLSDAYIKLYKEWIQRMSHIQNVKDELSQLKSKAAESDKLISAFMANICHEIRTPMNAIMGFSQLLLETGITREEQADFVQIINTNSQQLLSIINNMIDISKIDAGLFAIDTESMNINVFLNELFETYKKPAELKNLSIISTGHPPRVAIQIQTAGGVIKKIMGKLLENAIKFTRQGEIAFGYRINDHGIALYVKDTGIGISPANQDLIFKRFRQAETSKDCLYGGNGLGLSISKALAEKLGGSITVHSRPGKGSTFTLTLPLSYISS